MTAPVGAVKAAVDLYFTYGTGWVAYDDVTFVPTAGGTNLVPDPGFEDGDGWTDKIWSVYGNSTSHWRGDWGFGDPRSGTYSHVITNTAYGWLESDLFDVSAGETYNLSTYIRGRIDPDDSRDGWVWAVRVNWFDSSQVRIGYDHAAGGAPTTMPGTWTEVGDEVVAPVGAIEANIRIYLYMGSGWINIDDVTFESPLVTETVYYSIGTETVGMRQHHSGEDELFWLLWIISAPPAWRTRPMVLRRCRSTTTRSGTSEAPPHRRYQQTQGSPDKHTTPQPGSCTTTPATTTPPPEDSSPPTPSCPTQQTHNS